MNAWGSNSMYHQIRWHADCTTSWLVLRIGYPLVIWYEQVFVANMFYHQPRQHINNLTSTLAARHCALVPPRTNPLLQRFHILTRWRCGCKAVVGFMWEVARKISNKHVCDRPCWLLVRLWNTTFMIATLLWLPPMQRLGSCIISAHACVWFSFKNV